MADNKQDKRIYTLSREKPSKAVIKMGVPLIAGMFIMVLYNLVDTYFIGLMRDDYQLAAVNLAYPVMMIMIAVSNMVGTGASSLIARSIGAGNRDKANHTLTVAFGLTVLNSAIVASIGLLLLPRIVRGLGAQANTFAYTEQYVSVILIGSLFTMGNYTFGQLLRSEGSVRHSIAGMITGTIVNIILDPVFIFALGLEIRGAAIATIIGNAAGMAVSLWFYISGKTLLAPSLSLFRPTADNPNPASEGMRATTEGLNSAAEGMRPTAEAVHSTAENTRSTMEILKEIYWVGVPASLETLLTSAAYIVNNKLAVQYGELTVAAMGVAQKIMSLGSYIYQGFAAGTQPIMGYNYGAGNQKRMLDVLRAGLLIVSATELCVMAVYGFLAPQLIGIFSENADVIATGSRVLRTIMWILPFVGAVSMCRMSFQAMGKPQYAFGITLVRQLFLYVPLLLILNRLFGFGGMLRAQPITEFIMMIASVRLLTGVIRGREA